VLSNLARGGIPVKNLVLACWKLGDITLVTPVNRK